MTTQFRIALRKYAERWRVWAFLGCVLLVGMGTGSTVTTLIFQEQAAADDRQIQELTNQNQRILGELVGKVDQIITLMPPLLQTAQTAATKAESASSTARSAATTARGAAKNAAKAAAESQIRIREVKPRENLKVKP